jgi:hypothetical protein
VGEEHVLLEHAVVGVDDRQGAGGRVGGGDRGHRGPGDTGLVAGRLSGVQSGAAPDPDHHIGRALAGHLGDTVDLPVGADAAEDLARELDPSLGERRREPVAGQVPDVLVGDHERLAAELGHVLAERGQHAAALDVAARGDERLERSRFCHRPSPPGRHGGPSHLRLAG